MQQGEQGVYMCHYCQKISPDNKRCSLCKTTWYCNVECQRQDWPQHKLSCKTQTDTQQNDAKESSESSSTIIKTVLATTGIVAVVAGLAYLFGRTTTSSETVTSSDQ